MNPAQIAARSSALRYRPDIDGLRAAAIIPVVAFHYRLPGFSGGFVGVDVFFVISGFLITSLIAAEIRAGAFSVLRFYERRIRRIFPALFAMLAVVSLFAGIVLFPSDLQRYAMSLIDTALSVSNFHFWSTAGYFDPAAETKPLLHTWSLAVEEQFYLVFPVLLWLAGRARATQFRLAAILFAASFAAGVWAAHDAPVSAFYLLPFRMWELMLGALLALGPVGPAKPGYAAEACAALGLALIAWGVFAITPEMPFPGETAFVPCFGAALLIYGNGSGRTVVARLLSLRGVVFVGRISYSLYLWHWPLYVLARYRLMRDLNPAETVGLIVVSAALAVLSWAFIERPFRAGDKISRAAVFRLSGAAFVSALLIGAIGNYDKGFPGRYDLPVRQLLAASQDRDAVLARCFDPTPAMVRAHRLCRIGAVSRSTPSFVVWGDSHADAILPAIVAVETAKNRSGYETGRDRCPPLLGVGISRSPECEAFDAEAVKIATERNIKDVILVAEWAAYTEGTPYEGAGGGDIVLSDETGGTATAGDNHEIFARGLEKTVAALVAAGKHVVIVADVPEVGPPVPETLARIALAGTARDIRPQLDHYLKRQAFALAEFEKLRAGFGITVLYPHRTLCAGGSCEIAQDGMPLYRDGHHLTTFGAVILEPLFRAAL